jgi:hypothetical protein
MEYFIGALIPVLFFICTYLGYKLGQRSRVPVAREIDEQEQRKAKQLRAGFEQLMSYDVTKAVSGKKVT